MPADKHVTFDWDRRRRCGFPEVVYGEGKSLAVLQEIVAELVERDENVLVTRVDDDKLAELIKSFPASEGNETARTFRLMANSAKPIRGNVAIISAGTSDLPVTEEARETLLWMGIQATVVHDVGVAGPHRLPERLAEFEHSDAIVVVAGMEGALPSIVGGYVACPVIAVPTSVGYGANLAGMAPLLGMLNSCASNVAVVNIDAGFKAGYMAGLIASRAAKNSNE